jgi:hypothetical protein
MQTALTLVGAAIEAVGLFLLFAAAGRIRRRELGQPGWLQRVVAEARHTWRNPAPQVIQVGGASVTMSAGGADVVTIPADEHEALLLRVERLEAQQARAGEIAERRHREAMKKVDAHSERLDRAVAELRDSQRTSLIRAVRVERWGSALFVVGLVLQTAGQVA